MALDALAPKTMGATEREAMLGMFIAALEAGEFDGEIIAIYERLNRRHRHAQEEQAHRALAELKLGDRVVFPTDAVPKYLRGVTGDIVAFDGEGVIVCMGRPLGRFTTGHVRTSPVGIVKLASAQSGSVPE